ncbi:MAG: PfkB family carbohydrate kinase [Candidatus Bathyarchaeota archaeon]|nr:PfkB family carbohydrate kinase [Candidatus Bathyarchaeota archaeon]
MFDVTVVGHFAIDSIFLTDRQMPYVILGGSTAYVSLTVRRLNGRASILSKVGSDFPEAYLWWLREEGIDVSGVIRVKDAQTTRFELKYAEGFLKRTLRLKSRAPSITVEDLPKSVKSKAVHIAPIAGEITYEAIEKLRSCGDVLSIDPQGLVRNFDTEGYVTYSPLLDKRILELANIYKSSLEEIKAATGLSDLNSAVKTIHDYGVETVIVTLGAQGALLSIEGTKYTIPACPCEKIVDPTGAGDAFIGGFLAEYVRGEDSLWCAYVGSAAASIAVEAVGPTFMEGETEIHQRARLLYGKEIKE